jgi:hypothetical protein
VVGIIKGMGEGFWYLVFNLSSVTGIYDGGWWLEYQQWQQSYFCVAVGNIKGMSEVFWYLVLSVSSVTGIRDVGLWFEYQQW